MREHKNLFIALLLLLLLLCSNALAQQEIQIEDAQIRLTVEDDWVVFTRDNLSKNASLLSTRGTTAEALGSAYKSSNIYAEFFSSDRQVTLYAVDVSASGLPSQYSLLSYAQHSDFLSYVARLYQYESGTFTKEMPMFALFQKKEENAGVVLYTQSLITLRYHRLYIFEAVSVGHELSTDARAFLFDAASSMAFLGENPVQAVAGEDTPLSLPESTYAPKAAEVRITQDAVPVTLTFSPAEWNNLYLTVTGTTLPNTSLRYYLSGEGGERFKSDENGAFSCKIKFPKNGQYNVSIQAIDGENRGAAAFSVEVTRAETPVLLASTDVTSSEEEFSLRGVTLPGASVKLVSASGRETEGTVNADGSFALVLSTGQEGAYAFTVRAQSTGYTAVNIPVTCTRIASPDQLFNDHASSALPLTYAQVLSGRNDGALLKIDGSVTGFSSVPEGCAFYLSAEDGTYLVLTDSLYGIHLGQQKTILATVSAIPDGQTLPTVTLLETRP